MPESRPNPPRRSVFAVWRWPRWVWIVLVTLSVLYPFSCGPVFYTMQRADVPDDWIVCVSYCYLPLFVVCEFVPACGMFIDWQFDLMVALFGNVEHAT